MPASAIPATVQKGINMKARIHTAMLLVLGLLMPAPAPVRAQSIEWTQRPVSGPSPRDSHAMTQAG